MYLVTYENGEENYFGPFERVELDGVTDHGFIFLCSDPVNGVSRHCVSGAFEFITKEYLEA